MVRTARGRSMPVTRDCPCPSRRAAPLPSGSPTASPHGPAGTRPADDGRGLLEKAYVMSVGRIIASAAMVRGLAMLLGSCAFKTRREGPPRAGHAGRSPSSTSAARRCPGSPSSRSSMSLWQSLPRRRSRGFGGPGPTSAASTATERARRGIPVRDGACARGADPPPARAGRRRWLAPLSVALLLAPAAAIVRAR